MRKRAAAMRLLFCVAVSTGRIHLFCHSDKILDGRKLRLVFQPCQVKRLHPLLWVTERNEVGIVLCNILRKKTTSSIFFNKTLHGIKLAGALYGILRLISGFCHRT